MIWSKARWQHSFELFPRVLKEVAFYLFPLSLLLWGLEYYTQILNKQRFENPYESSMTLILVVGLSGVIIQSLTSVFSMLFIAKSTQRQMHNGQGDFCLPFTIKHFNASLIESTRGFISVGLYTLVLIIPASLIIGPAWEALNLGSLQIITRLPNAPNAKPDAFASIDRLFAYSVFFLPFVAPGLMRWVQMMFVSLIPAFDPSYQNGDIDALKKSSQLVQGAWFSLLFLLIFTMLLPTVIAEQSKGADVSLVMGFVYLTLSWLVSLFFGIYLSLTFFARWSFKTSSR